MAFVRAAAGRFRAKTRDPAGRGQAAPPEASLGATGPTPDISGLLHRVPGVVSRGTGSSPRHPEVRSFSRGPHLPARLPPRRRQSAGEELGTWGREEGPAGLPPRRPVARTRPLVSEPLGGRGPLIAGCRCPAEVKGRRGHSLDERGCPCPERAPGRARGLAAEAAIASPGLLPWGLALLARGPGSPQVNAFCGRQGQEAADSLTEVGVRALGD